MTGVSLHCAGLAAVGVLKTAGTAERGVIVERGLGVQVAGSAKGVHVGSCRDGPSGACHRVTYKLYTALASKMAIRDKQLKTTFCMFVTDHSNT
jgi:hypothetical protein